MVSNDRENLARQFITASTPAATFFDINKKNDFNLLLSIVLDSLNYASNLENRLVILKALELLYIQQQEIFQN